MNHKLSQSLQKKLQLLKDQGLYNTIDVLESKNEAIITIKGKKLINMASNNYLGLATHPKLIEAQCNATRLYGVGSGAVRSINGTLTIHEELEQKLAAFKGTQAALVFQSGFNSNIGTIPALVSAGDAILSDALNHASIIEGCRLSGAKIIRYHHKDMDDLRQKAQDARKIYDKIMVITDGVFSMDGDIAPLDEIVAVAKQENLITYVDDAHGSGVLGNGAGTVKHFGLEKEIDIQMGTLSKAVGVVGGYIAADALVIDWLKVKARPFLFSTAMPPSLCQAIITAIEMIQDNPSLIETLWKNSAFLKHGLSTLGFDIGISETPITPVIIGNESLTQQFAHELQQAGVYAKAIVYPTVALGSGRIRNMPTVLHDTDLLQSVIATYAGIGKTMGLIT